MLKEDLFTELYNEYGPVTRARGPFLYTKKGVRLVDLYQENGRAILGWEGGNAFTMIKNTLCRGQVGSFICEEHSKVQKAVSQLLNSERSIYYFNNKMDALKMGLIFSPDNTAFYSPWSPNQQDWAKVESIVLAPPLPMTDSVYILALKDASGIPVAKNITIPYALECGIARSIYNLIKALQEREEKDWFIYDPILTKYWTRKGPYLEPKVPADVYNAFVLHCLALGIVINPDHKASIVPYGADKGVFTKLKNSPFKY